MHSWRPVVHLAAEPDWGDCHCACRSPFRRSCSGISSSCRYPKIGKQRSSFLAGRDNQRCQDYAASRLFTGNATGAIFVLKNNYAWKDTKEVDQTIRGLKLGDLYDAVTGLRPNEQEDDETDS